MNTRSILPLAGGLLALTLALPGMTQEYPTWTLSGGFLATDSDQDRQASSGDGFMVGIGRYLNPNVSVDLEYDDYYFDLDEGGDVDVDSLGLMLRYHFSPGAELRPYIGVGAGQADHDSARGKGDNFMAQAAGGIHYALTDRLDLRTELRYRHDSDRFTQIDGERKFGDLMLTVGLSYALGKAGTAPAAPAEPSEPAGPTDSDGDGVYDDRDRCPNTPAGVAVDVNGCPLDSDNDGVPDHRDDCPDTPAGAEVGPNGCQERLLIELPSVFFDFDKATLKPEAVEKLRGVVSTLTENDIIRIAIEGHTDWTGTEAYNIKLSERRAKAVYDHLAGNGIAESRMGWAGYGESRPVASNDTSEGRARNRRVEIRIVD